jgi:hypothetical protein
VRFLDLETHACGVIKTSGEAPVTDFINCSFFILSSGLPIEMLFPFDLFLSCYAFYEAKNAAFVFGNLVGKFLECISGVPRGTFGYTSWF